MFSIAASISNFPAFAAQASNTVIPRAFTTIHYEQLLLKTPYLTYFKNSVMVASLTTLISIIIGILAAYAITRLTFRGRTMIARATTITYLVPGSPFPISERYRPSSKKPPSSTAPIGCRR